MKLTKTKTSALAIAAGSLLLAFGSVDAQITTYATGDLVLYFQNPGGTTGSGQTVMVSLGAPQDYRDGDVFGPINIVGLDSLLSSTFGSDWYDQPTLYMGVAANRGTVNTSASHASQDPSRTLYVGDSRDGVGTVGVQNSAGYSVTPSNMGTAATNINIQNASLGTAGSSPSAIPVGSTTVDEQNPFVIPGQQGTAFGLFPGGVQYAFGAGSFGTYGTAGDVEGALDLYRIQSRSDSTGQYGFGDTALNGNGQYLGTITIDQDGVVNFTQVVPEPTSVALIGLGATALLAVNRRRRTQAIA